MATHHTSVLSPDRLSPYIEHGYLQLDSFVTPQWMARLRSASDEFVESQMLEIEGRTMRRAPDWRKQGPPMIFGSQQGR